MKKLAIVSALAAAFVASGAAADKNNFRINLMSYQEVPAVSSVATGSFKAEISRDDTVIDYELSYEGLEGPVTRAHIHFGQRSVNGGISLWLCQTPGTPAPAAVAGTTPSCPTSGTVSGTLTAANVIGPAAQGIAASEFAEIVAAIRAGVAYANVHSGKFPGGEIRGQLSEGKGDGGHHHDRKD
jgi:hypothetical protein